jgi:hypothetical protein
MVQNHFGPIEGQGITVSLALILFLSHRMQGYFRSPWPEDAVRNYKEAIINLIMHMKKKEKYLYQTASSRSDYFHSITRTVTSFQRTLCRERASKENQHGYIFPVWLNFPNVPPPLAPGPKDTDT